MSTAMTYGGWVTDRPAATGVSSTVVRWVGWVAAAGAVLSGLGTGGELSLEHLQRSTHEVRHMWPAVEVADVASVRNPTETCYVRPRDHLRRIATVCVQLAQWRDGRG